MAFEQIRGTKIDKWSTREKLCLASAVSCSGDQNWMSVSRSLKLLCGTTKRPNDWFSQKFCALQYGELLENVESPKRKKRCIAEKDYQIVETTTDIVLQKLTQERISELVAITQKEQEEYKKIKAEILKIENDEFTEDELKEKLVEIETENNQKLLEQQKYAQWLNEREEIKSKMQKAWHTDAQQNKNLNNPISSIIKSDDTVTDETIPKQSASPLLTSLLKSPCSTNSITVTEQSHVVTSHNATISAPTITNLLTGNSQIHSSISTATSGQVYSNIQNQPLTGPCPNEPPLHVTPSPSQTAPTLSMLLENKANQKKISVKEFDNLDGKSKEHKKEQDTPQNRLETSTSKDEEQQLLDVFNGLIPDNIDELADILTSNNAIILNPELLEEESILDNVESYIEEQGHIQHGKAKNSENIKTDLKALSSKNEFNSPKQTKCETNNEIDSQEVTELDNKPKFKDSSGVEIAKSPKSSFDNVNITAENITVKCVDAESIDENSKEQKNKKIENEIKTNDEEEILLCITTGSEVAEMNTSIKDTIVEPVVKSIEQVKDKKIDINESINFSEKTKEDSIKETDSSKSENITLEKQEKKIEENNSKDVNKDFNYDEVSSGSTEEILIKTNNTVDIPKPIYIDNDVHIEIVNEDKDEKTKCDYSRKKIDYNLEKKIDESVELPGFKKLKENEQCDSPMADEEQIDILSKTKRRYSSTPIIDSVPNSPASSDDREMKAWKKSILLIYNRLSTHKYASIFLKPVTEDMAPNYKKIILRPIDLQTIKRNIETGVIRTTVEFQRDVMLMCHNAMIYNQKDKNIYNMAKEMFSDALEIIESLPESIKKEADKNSINSGTKIRGRKSNRLS